jgi:hypothetical protein
MCPSFVALKALLLMFAGWVNRRQLDVIGYLQEENRVLKERLGGRRLRFGDVERRRLASASVGRAFVDRAAALLREADDLDRTLRRSTNADVGEVSFGMGPLAAQALRPTVLSKTLETKRASLQRPLLVRLSVAIKQMYWGPVHGGSGSNVQTSARLHAGDASVGVEPPLLVRLTVTGPDDERRPVGCALAGSVQAPSVIENPQLPGGRHVPLLVGHASTVRNVHRRT